MKTKEPAVMMAALAVFKQVGKIADTEFLAMDALPVLWSFSLGPLLNLQQFQQFMDLIKKLSARIEGEQIKKLHDLSSNANSSMDASRMNDLMNVGSNNLSAMNGTNDVGEDDFQRLVLGSKSANKTDMLGDTSSRAQPSLPTTTAPPMFEWSSPRPSMNMMGNGQASRAVTPDASLNNMNAFATLSPTPSTGAQGGMQRTMANGLNSFAPMQPAKSNVWPSMPQQQSIQPQSSFSIPPPPQSQPLNSFSNFSIAPSTANTQRPAVQQPFTRQPANSMPGMAQSFVNPSPQPPPKTGLDAYESLI